MKLKILIVTLYFSLLVEINGISDIITNSSTFDWDVTSMQTLSGPCTLWWPLPGVEMFFYEEQPTVSFSTLLKCVDNGLNYSGLLIFNSFETIFGPVPLMRDFTMQTVIPSRFAQLSHNRLTYLLFKHCINNTGNFTLISNISIHIKISYGMTYGYSAYRIPIQSEIYFPSIAMMSFLSDNFAKLLNLMNLTNISIQVGAGANEFSTMMLSKWIGNKYIIIDPWKLEIEYNFESFQIYSTQEKYDDAYLDLQQRMSPYYNRVEIKKMKSKEAIQLVTPKSLDFVYLSGNFDYFTVMSELRRWWPMIKKGGILGGYSYSKISAKYAITEFSRKMNIPFYLTDDQRSSWYMFVT